MRFFSFIFCVMVLGCQSNPSSMIDEQKLKSELIKLNQNKQSIEADSLKSYIQHQGWKMERTPTGMYYEIIQTKQGKGIQSGNVVAIFYKIFLLNGNLCYDNTLTHPIRFKVGEDHVETGLHQLMPLLKVGDEVRVVMPSHLAFGFTGDSNKIPGDSPLYYEIKVVSVQ